MHNKVPGVFQDGCPGLLLLHLVKLHQGGVLGALGGDHGEDEFAAWY